MIIAMSCTKEWYHYLVVDLYSLLECTKSVKKIYLLLETEKIDEIEYLLDIKKKYKVEIILVNIKEIIEKHLSKKSPNRDTIYSNFCFGRLLLPEIVKEDKVLYIDTDAIVRRDISNIWKYDLLDNYAAGVRDYGILDDDIPKKLGIKGKYINSGFVIFNLKKIRKEKIMTKWFELINKTKLEYPDQDALNYVCNEKEMYIPSMYNYITGVTMEVPNKNLIKVFHFAGEKNFWVVDRFHAEEWYDAEEKFLNEFKWSKS